MLGASGQREGLHVVPPSALWKIVPSMVETYTSLGRFGFTATAAGFLSPFPMGFQLSPVSVDLKSPSRIATYMTLALVGSTAKPFTVRLVGRPPTSFHPQKQSGSRQRPSAVPA